MYFLLNTELISCLPAAQDFYNEIETLDPDNGDKILVCLGGDFTKSKQDNLPLRGLDSNYKGRYCDEKSKVILDPDTKLPIGVVANSTQCDHYTDEEIKTIPHITENVKAGLKFLGKADRGFFMMYEQGDIDWAAHANHMDDMLGAMFDIDDSVKEILSWIKANGGWEKNALYVTADHDHYLTLLPQFPEALANFIIAGESHKITPRNNSNVNPQDVAVAAKRQNDTSKPQISHIRDFTTWTEQDIAEVGHFWGARGSGGNGWGSHSTRPVPLYYEGDNGCVEALMGKDYQVVGRVVKGVPEKIDQVHLHACMLKSLFGLGLESTSPTAPASPVAPKAPAATPSAPVVAPVAPKAPATPSAPVAPTTPVAPKAPATLVAPVVPVAPPKAPTAPLPKLTGLDLFHGLTNRKIVTLTNGVSVPLPSGMSSPALSVVATYDAAALPKIESVVFSFKGNPRYNVENTAVYALCKNSGTDIFSCGRELGCGVNQTVTATPYTADNGQGTAGAPVTVTFTITGCAPPRKNNK
jgi:hypothetical protein